jgi:hypothetical protein
MLRKKRKRFLTTIVILVRIKDGHIQLKLKNCHEAYSIYLLEFFKMTRAVDAIFLDFAKAFNKVLRKRLLNRLKAHGERRQLLNWMTTCLENRKQ